MCLAAGNWPIPDRQLPPPIRHIRRGSLQKKIDDLSSQRLVTHQAPQEGHMVENGRTAFRSHRGTGRVNRLLALAARVALASPGRAIYRSEERRVGKECRS